MADAQTPAAASATPPEVKKKRPKMLLIAVVVILCLGCGGGYVVMSRRAIAGSKKGDKAGTQSATAQKAAPVAIIPLESFLVNLADPDHDAFLKVTISLGFSKTVPKVESPNELPFIPETRDTILGVLTTWQSNDLLEPAGKTKLKAQILSALEQRMPQLGVEDVYFTDFLIQR